MGRCGAGLNVPFFCSHWNVKHDDTYAIQRALFPPPDMRDASGTVLLCDGGLSTEGGGGHQFLRKRWVLPVDTVGFGVSNSDWHICMVECRRIWRSVWSQRSHGSVYRSEEH